MKRLGSIVSCPTCDKKFATNGPVHIYCSEECRPSYYRRQFNPPRDCDCCKEEFIPNRPNQRFCSTACRKQYWLDVQRHKEANNNRMTIFDRDKFQCVYCGSTSYGDGAKLHVEHIIPQKLGGCSIMDNLITSCDQCNIEKSSRRLLSESELLEEAKRRNSSANIDGALLVKIWDR